jgi:hypothetical protein
MYARPPFVVVGISEAFSSEVAAGSRQENASNQKSWGIFPLFPRQMSDLEPALGINGGCGYTLAP